MPVVSVPSSGSSGAVIQVEVDTLPASEGNVYGEVRESKVIKGARDLFGEGLALVRSCATRVTEVLGDLAQESRPDELKLKLAIKLDSEVGAVIAKLGAGAQLQVEIKWKCEGAAAPPIPSAG